MARVVNRKDKVKLSHREFEDMLISVSGCSRAMASSLARELIFKGYNTKDSLNDITLSDASQWSGFGPARLKVLKAMGVEDDLDEGEKARVESALPNEPTMTTKAQLELAKSLCADLYQCNVCYQADGCYTECSYASEGGCTMPNVVERMIRLGLLNG